MMTDDLNLGLINNSEENITDATNAISVAMKIGFLFFQRNNTKLVESNRLPLEAFSVIKIGLGFINFGGKCTNYSHKNGIIRI
jgi:hypothetical protein